MDLDDKAISRHTKIPPALLEEIHKGNEAALTGVVRAQMAFLLEHALERAALPDAPVNLITALLEIQRKIASPTKTEASGGQAFHLTLNLGDGAKEITVDSSADIEDAEYVEAGD